MREATDRHARQRRLEQTLYQAFLHVYHQDIANAALHGAPVRYSPLTFRLAEQLAELGVQPSATIYADVWAVMLDKGTYDEDTGR